MRELKHKTYPELFVGFFKLIFWMFYYTGYSGVYLIKLVTREYFPISIFAYLFFQTIKAILPHTTVIDAWSPAGEVA